MAHLYQRGRQYWISYYVSGDLRPKIAPDDGRADCPGKRSGSIRSGPW